MTVSETMTGGALARLGIEPEAAGESTSDAQSQTEAAFSFKWAKRDTYESAAVQESSKAWLVERYCGGDESVVDEWLERENQIILDAGCGAGHSALLLFGDRLKRHDYLGVDISDAVQVAKKRFAERGIPGDFLQGDLTSVGIPDSSLDIIFSEGVLHHTDSTEESFKHLARKLAPGGQFLFYVYAKKGAIREFTDDHVRAAISGMPDEEAWEALKPLTKLGIALGEMNAEITVPDDIPYLGIKAGTHDIQRLFYWAVCKAYYKPDWSLDELNHINFDWFRPSNCHSQTPADVQRWCDDAGLNVKSMNVQEAGITVVAQRPSTTAQ